MKEEGMYFERKNPDNPSDDRILGELRERNKPVYIYGACATAASVGKKLAENGIGICGFFVDNAYYSGEGEGEYPIFSFDYVMGLPEADVVVGFYEFGIACVRREKGKLCNKGKVFFFSPEPLFDYAYYLANREKFHEAYDLLEDDFSRETMRAYMDGRMNGLLRPMLDCCVPDQYFIPEMRFAPNEVYIDCGMYDGDSIAEFIRHCPNYAYIVGFEPDAGNLEKFRLRNLSMDRMEIYSAGVWSEKTELCFSADGTMSSRVAESGGASLQVMSIDSLELKQPVTFIKMDIEGSELEALKGARETIRRDMPKLAICVYHRKEDMVTIPQYIKSLEPAGRSYAFYLRHHSLCDNETVLYAIPT